MARNNQGWRETGWLKENHESPLYGISFNFCSREHHDLFATAGQNRAAIFRCLPGGAIETLQVFEDAAGDAEDYFACRWSVDVATGAPLLLLAGKNSLLHVIDCNQGVLLVSLEGHGQPINDIAVHPTRPHYVVTASKDNSLRLWNLKSRVCALTFQGDGGHRNEVLSVDWKPGGSLTLVSGSMDDRVKIWDLSSLESFLKESDAWDVNSGTTFQPRQVTMPAFSTKHVHGNYVDYVRWFGDALLSKSVDDTIVCWQPETDAAAVIAAGAGASSRREHASGMDDDPVRFIHELKLSGTRDMWWLRYSLDFNCSVLAQGTHQGRVLIYDLMEPRTRPVARLQPKRTSGKSEYIMNSYCVRLTAVSYDGSIVVALHENGSITRYDKLSDA